MMYNLVSAACLVLFVIPKGAPAGPTQGHNSHVGLPLMEASNLSYCHEECSA